MRSDSTPLPSPRASEAVQKLLHQQQLQGELLDQQRKELSEMLTRQLQLETEMEAYRGATPTTPHPTQGEELMAAEEGEEEEESPNFFPGQRSTVAEGAESANGVGRSASHDWITGYLPQTSSKAELEEAELARPVTCEQAINTDAWTQEVGVVTDPIMTSTAVGTECDAMELELNLEANLTTPSDTPKKKAVTPNSDQDLDPNLATPQGTPRRSIKTPNSEPEMEPDLKTPQETPLRVTAEERDSRLDPDLETPRSRTPSECSETVPTPVPTLPPSPQHSPLPTPSLTPTRQHLRSHSPNLDDLDDNTTPTNSSFLMYPKEEDPLINQHVLARWPDDGWYYRAIVVRPVGQLWYQVKDASQDVETIHVLDIIIDLQDAQKPMAVGDTVAALHPNYDYSYAPGRITGMAADGFHFSVKLYDGAEAFLPRQDVYHLAQAKHQRDVEYLRTREKAWVGQAVLARRDKDGLYLPGKSLRPIHPFT